ncbi:endo-1,6-alpha-mannosidase [Dendrothele bispora CBS 962.96]|uniref:Endo-1,6-alpha-mannosidase n=1 Tax=Dendrothele bispora (strain CBS 962.96) TaxID=1314807 RepID=A0A4S8LGF2_DENBC|nr:endo-1,6-alpha-mannosidase [Dendrothele bispora CBS 962.96]
MILSPPYLLAICSLISFSFAQDLGVPLSWRKFSNSRGRDERITIARSAIDAILPQLDSGTGEFNGIGYWQSGNVYSAMANFDHLAASNVYQGTVTNNLNTAFGLHAHYDKFQSVLCLLRGGQQALYMPSERMVYVSCHSHLAIGLSKLKDNNLLSHAIDTWNHVSGFVVTAQDAASGSHPQKSFTLAGTCDGITMAGGVFWRPTSDDQSINSITTGLSAFLAEITGDSKYTDAAVLSAQWMKNHNINTNNLVLDTVNGHDCSRSPASWLFTYNNGKFLEGLSVLKDVTRDDSWRSLMVNIAAASMKSAPWQGSDGIITEGASPDSNNDGVGFKAVFIRGLDEVSVRSADNNALQILIHSYGDVQYNALLDLAANGNTYSSSWTGPPQDFTTWGQLAALDVLVTNINTNSP